MINANNVRKRIFSAIGSLIDLEKTISKFEQDPNTENGIFMAKAFGNVSSDFNTVVAGLEDSISNMVKLASTEDEEVDMVVEEDNNGFLFK